MAPTEVTVRWRWRGGGLQRCHSERQNDGEHRFKPCPEETDWLKEGKQKSDWSWEMMTVFGFDSVGNR